MWELISPMNHSDWFSTESADFLKILDGWKDALFINWPLFSLTPMNQSEKAKADVKIFSEYKD